jgi:hypothetical protein
MNKQKKNSKRYIKKQDKQSEEDNNDDEDGELDLENRKDLAILLQEYFAESGKSIKEEEEAYDESQPETLKKVIDKGVNIIIGFIAVFISDLLLEEDETTELTIMVIIIYAIWFTIDQFIREYIRILWAIQRNTVYRDVVIDIVNLLSYLGIYTISKLALDILNSLWKSSNINLGEAFVSLTTIIVSLYAVYRTYDHLSK